MAEFNKWYYDKDEKTYCFCTKLKTINGWFGWEASKTGVRFVEFSFFTHPDEWNPIIMTSLEPNFLIFSDKLKMIKDIFKAE
jgi:hypothetical protein